MDIPHRGHVLPCTPHDIPNLVSFWDFAALALESGSVPAAQGEPYTLQNGAGNLRLEADLKAPFHGQAARFDEGTWLRIPRAECPRLDVHGPGRGVTVCAWIKRERCATNHCEFLAGQWNETHLGRQYGLFLNIGVWGGSDQICGHLSHCGGPTPGYKYCMDGAIGATPVTWDTWHTITMVYDGTQGYAYLDGLLDPRPGINPYSLAGGLHNGGPTGSDFTVGGVHRSGEMGNFFSGLFGGLAVYDRALTPAEVFALHSLLPQ